MPDLQELLQRVQQRMERRRTAPALVEEPAPSTSMTAQDDGGTGVTADEGPLARFWNLINRPLLPQIGEAGRGIADTLTEHTIGESKPWAMAKGALAGMIGGTESQDVPWYVPQGGAAGVAESMTSPLGIATSGAGGAAARALKTLGRTERAASVIADRLPIVGGERQFFTSPRPAPRVPVDPTPDQLIESLGVRPMRLMPDAPIPPPPPSPARAEVDQLIGTLGLEGTPTAGSKIIGRLDAPAAAADVSDLDASAFIEKLGLSRPTASVPPTPPSPPVTRVSDIDAMMRETPRALPVEPPALSPASPIHPVQKLYDTLLPKWAASRAKNADIPFDVPDEPFPEFYQRVLTDDPRQLWGAERKVRAGIDAATPEGIAPSARLSDLLRPADSEAGFIDPQAVVDTLKAAPAAAEQLQYASMLGAPSPQIKNVLGAITGPTQYALEEALAGRFGRAGKVLKEFYSPKTLSAVKFGYQRPQPGRWGRTTGPLSVPGRTMGSIDYAAKDALMRARVTPELARDITMTGESKTAFGRDFQKFLGKHRLTRQIVPFARTATNLFEQGLASTPGVGYVTQAATGGKLATSIPKQILGAAAMYGGYKAGEAAGTEGLSDRSQGLMNNRYLQAALGVRALPFILASEYAARGSSGSANEYDKTRAAFDALLKLSPAVVEARDYDPRNMLSRFMPNVDWVPGVPGEARDYETSHSWLNPLIAKIPWLRDRLLDYK